MTDKPDPFKLLNHIRADNARRGRAESKRIDDLVEAGLLWVCQCCDVHLNADNVGDNCQSCGAEAYDDG